MKKLKRMMKVVWFLTCENCKWLEEGNWCDMLKVRLDNDINLTKQCNHYDDTLRNFDPQVFYNLCKDYVELYERTRDNMDYMKKEDEFANYNETEFMRFVLNDMSRELAYYHDYNLYGDLNRVRLPITQRK